MFMVPGSKNVVRVNGLGAVLADEDVRDTFEKGGKRPRTVIEVTVQEAYFQCAKALMRSELWSGKDLSKTVPSAGDFVKEINEDFDGAAYDSGYTEYAKPKMW